LEAHGVAPGTVESVSEWVNTNSELYQSFNGGLWSLPQRACTEKSKLNMI